MKRRASVLAIVGIALVLAGCPLGRKDNVLGGDCASANDCPMGTTGLFCKDKTYCTKSCKADADCAGAKGAAMTCAAGECTRK